MVNDGCRFSFRIHDFASPGKWARFLVPGDSSCCMGLKSNYFLFATKISLPLLHLWLQYCATHVIV